MSADIPGWLKRSSKTIKANAQETQNRVQSELAKKAREIPYDQALSTSRDYWEQMNTDDILSDLNILLGGDLGDLSWNPHFYTGSEPNASFIHLDRRISEEYTYYDQDRGGKVYDRRSIFSITLRVDGFSVCYGGKHTKKLGFPKNEDNLKDEIDKFISSIR